MAEYHYLRYDLAAAIEQLESARRRVGDSFYLQASIDARLDEFRRELSQVEELN
jgi:predicted Zn-dependent protease